jgi:amidase
VLILPNLPYIANSHASVDGTSSPLDLIGKQVGLTSNTAPFNQSGHPVLAMPIGKLEIQEGELAGKGVKLPVSMQVVGRWLGEESVYKAAYAWSESFDWAEL